MAAVQESWLAVAHSWLPSKRARLRRRRSSTVLLPGAAALLDRRCCRAACDSQLHGLIQFQLPVSPAVDRILTADTPAKRTVLELFTKEVAGSANSRQGVKPLLMM